MASIQDEIKAFQEMRPQLEAEHMGEWVVVHDRTLVDLYRSFEAAASDAVSRFGGGPFLIRQIGAPPVTLPISVMYHRPWMLSANCGYEDAPQGPKLLGHFGPRIWVNIGFDAAYRPTQNAAPKANITNVEALVDTGAQESCIDDLLAAEIGLQIIDQRTVVGVGAEGGIPVNVHLAQIHIPVLRFTEYGAFAAVPLIASGFRYKAVIGRTFLRHMVMSYDGTTGAVRINRPDW
jgi:hypothetical protein